MFYERTGDPPTLCMDFDPSHFRAAAIGLSWPSSIFTPSAVRAFHVKDARSEPYGRQGVSSGFQPWINRAGRFRLARRRGSQFKAIFSRLGAIGFDRWAVLEWECCLKNAEGRCPRRSCFIREHVIRRPPSKHFTTLARSTSDDPQIRRTLRLPSDPIENQQEFDMAEGRIRLGMVGGGEGAFIRRRAPHRRAPGQSLQTCRRRAFGLAPK